MVTRMHVAMGGDALDRWHVVRLRGIAQRNLLEQSVRPEGPWLVDDFTFDDILDIDGARVRSTSAHRGYVSDTWFEQTAAEGELLVFADGIAQQSDGGPARFNAARAQDMAEELALGPFAIARTALAATDLHVAPSRSVNGFAQPVVAFTWRGTAVDVVLNATTNLPVEVDFTRARPYDVFWNVWGDVAERIRYESYNEETAGIHLPREIDVERDGLPLMRHVITKIDVGPAVDATTFALESSVRAAAPSAHAIDDLPFGGPSPRPAAIARNVTVVPGNWNVTFVVQSDGIVMIEAPISSAYAEAALAFARGQWPALAVKAVVTTSDAWPHIGGVRAVVAHGIPLYGPRLNRPLVVRLVNAPHRERPDALARRPRALQYRDVDSRTTLGSGDGALVLAPYITPNGERQMMVYLPAAKLLYTSDLFQPIGDGWFTAQTVDECVQAVRRERFEVTTAFGMHYGATAWSSIVAARDAARTRKT